MPRVLSRAMHGEIRPMCSTMSIHVKLQTKSTPMGVGGRGRAVAARAKAKAGGK